MEAEFFVNQNLRCFIDDQKILALQWSAVTSTHKFRDKLLDVLKCCRNSASFNENYEARMFFRLKLSHQRSENNAICNAITDMNSMEDDTNMECVLEAVMAIFLRKHTDGIVPHDITQLVDHAALNDMVLSSQLHANTFFLCQKCGENFPETGECSARHNICSHFSRLGHFDEMRLLEII